MTKSSRRIDFLSWNKLAEEMERTDVAIIPVGAVEPHGRHSPLGTDAFIALEIAERLAEASGGLVFPPMPLGTIQVAYDFRSLPGCISLDPKLLIDLYTNIGTELARNGFKRLVFVNGHGPNGTVLQIVAYQIREKVPVEVGIVEWWATSDPVIKEIKGFSFGSHADQIETSLVMASEHGHLVNLAEAVVNSPTLEDLSPDESALYRAKIPFTRTWDERWIGESGNMGDPTPATAEKGNRIMEPAIKVGLQVLDVLAEQLQRRK
jgi:creatinine amidohydrolase